MMVDMDRVEEVAHDLAGTCESIEKFATDEERDNRIFCEELDSKVFCCEVCGWWCFIDEESPTVDGACDECEPGDDDD